MAIKIIDLSDKNWKFRQVGNQKWHPAKVPGCIHTDLYNNRLIEDPFFGLNERKLQWIEEKDWEYQLNFDSPEDIHKYTNCSLEFDGLDTYAEIFLNGSHILSSNNMFIPFETDIYSCLNSSENQLKIIFHSPFLTAKEDYEKLEFEMPAHNDQGNPKVSPFTRKASYMYGWDWGPRLLTSGIWKSVRLKLVSTANIVYSSCSVSKLNKKKTELELDYELEIMQPDTYNLEIKIDDDVVFNKSKYFATGKVLKRKRIVIKRPELWWPRGFGTQKLYKVEVVLKKKKEILDKKQFKIGIRSIQLKQVEDENGSSFTFRINGKDIFIRGANLIPIDYFPSEITNKKYDELLDNALSINLNMLRSCGEGIYESDYFYELCDEKGILVWQDFKFAGSMYPSNPKFIENIEREITWQVRRLKYHPCLVLWCGNNAILEGFFARGWKEQLGENSKIAWNSYKRIFKELIPSIIEREDKNRHPYWPSSPSPGLDLPPKLSQGDYHLNNIDKETKPYSVIGENTGRFMSGFGFKSYPELRSIQSFLDKSDWDTHSEAMGLHQGIPAGIQFLKKNMEWFYPRPKNFQHFLYISQLIQADAIEYTVENHRKSKPWCMGSLYRQMNDCWPAASCSGIDYYGRWKAMHYRLKTIFKDVLLSVSEKDGTLLIHGISDLPETKRLRLNLRIIDFKGKLIAEHNSIEEFNHKRTLLIYQQKLQEFITEKERPHVVLDMCAFEGNHLLYSNLYYFVRPRELLLEKPDISMHIEKKFNKVFLFIQTQKLAKNIYLVNIKTDGFFSENFFDLLPGEDKVVVFEAKENNDFMIKDFRFMSLWNCM